MEETKLTEQTEKMAEEAQDLKKALQEIEELKREFKRRRMCLSKDEYEYRNMLLISLIIIESALGRKESRGAHCRSDYPQTNETSEHSKISKLEEKEPVYAK